MHVAARTVVVAVFIAHCTQGQDFSSDSARKCGFLEAITCYTETLAQLSKINAKTYCSTGVSFLKCKKACQGSVLSEDVNRAKDAINIRNFDADECDSAFSAVYNAAGRLDGQAAILVAAIAVTLVLLVHG